LADPDIYDESAKMLLKQILERKVKVDKALDDAEMAWMEAEEKIENAT
jgi:ATP-binding cassette subfamily F protein 3